MRRWRKVLYLDDDTIRTWHRLYQEDGIEGLASFGYEGCVCRLTTEQRVRLTAWITEALPRTSREIGAWIARECGIEYEGRSGLIALLHRLGMEHRKPTAISRKLDPAKQAAFIRSYEALLTSCRLMKRSLMRCASDACCASGRLLGTEGDPGGDHTEQRAGTAEHPRRDRS